MARTVKYQVAWGNPSTGGINYFPASISSTSPTPVIMIGDVDNYIDGSDISMGIKIDPATTVYSMQRFLRVWFLDDDDSEILSVRFSFEVTFSSPTASSMYSFWAGLATPNEYSSGTKKPNKLAPSLSYMSCFAGADHTDTSPTTLTPNIYQEAGKYYTDYLILQSKFINCNITNPVSSSKILMTYEELI